MNKAPGTDFVCVPVRASIYNELVIRKGNPEVDVASWIENVVSDYLERTADDEMWSEQYYEWRASTEDIEGFKKEFGDPGKGYHWDRVFLPNGSRLTMTYRGTQHHAVVQHEQIRHEERSYSPSELARKIANNTNRNAWRDLMVKRPTDDGWVLADSLRHREGGR